MSERVMQEFYCRHCPADDSRSEEPAKRATGGHFRIKLSLGYNASLKVNCPKCGAEHTRHVRDGVIRDGQGSSDLQQEILKVGLSAWSREPMSALQQEAKAREPKNPYHADLRGGAVIKPDEQEATEKDDGWDGYRRNVMRERWAEMAERQKNGD